MEKNNVNANITKVLEQVSTAAKKYQRDPAEITVMAVSKTQTAEAVMTAAAAGMQHFGENYLQEALEKIHKCQEKNLIWHFIGPIQSNKTRAIAENFAWVHSIDRAKILRRLAEQRPVDAEPLNICLQVNISGESTKSGISPTQLSELVALAQELPRLRLRGLMAIPAPSKEFEDQRAACETLAVLFRQAKADSPQMDTLSMGMSADMEAAIAAGSTMLRIGTAIFGQRQR